ncbi:GNAT family N-acetyltransferase [bacterium]|nr:GNAT family N-acetyltransferase [bacterium]
MPGNTASLAVLAKLGFRFTHEVPAAPGHHGWREHELAAADYHGLPSLRPIRDDDLPVLFAHQRDPVAVRMAAFTAENPDDEAAFRKKMARILADTSSTNRAIVVGGEVVGNVMAFEMFGERNVCYWLGREHWGRGHAGAALRAFLCEHDRRPLVARVVHDNAGSLKVLARCGFVVTGEDEGFAHGRGGKVREILLRLDGPPA